LRGPGCGAPRDFHRARTHAARGPRRMNERTGPGPSCEASKATGRTRDL
jgi:hypothetical protein